MTANGAVLILGWLFGKGKSTEAPKSSIATWGELLSTPPASFQLDYEVAGGISPYGDYHLKLDGTGNARLENLVINVQTVWTGKVEPATFKRLLTCLHEGNFPQVLPVPEELFVAGASVGRLTIAAAGQSGFCEIEVNSGNHDPSAQQAVHMLESLCHQLSEGRLKHTKNTLPPAVTDVQKAG